MRIVLGIILIFIGFYANAQSDFNFEKESFKNPVPLNGLWEFFPNELYTGSETEQAAPRFVEVPHDWGIDSTLNYQSTGYGTYQTRLILPKDRRELGLFIPHIFSSYRLFFNGELIHNQGDVQRTKQAYKPFRLPKVFTFKELGSDTLRITIQVANFDHENAGLYYPLEVGKYEKLIEQLTSRQYINMFLAGGLFLTGFILLAFAFTYNLLENAIPYYALFSLSLMYRMLGADPYPIHIIFPDMPFALSIHLEYLSIHSAAFFGGLFIFQLFPRQTNKWVVRLFYITSGISAFNVLLSSPVYFTSVLKYYLFIIIAYVVVFTRIIYKAKQAKEPTSGYLITALAIVFIWTLFQVTTFLGIGSVPYIYNVFLVSLIVIVCNLALFKTFMYRVNRVQLAESEVEYEKRKNTMLSLISHEIKMPVATLQMNMAMMKAAKDNPEKFNQIKDKMIDLSFTAVDSIKRMLNDFIYFMSPDIKSSVFMSSDELKELIISSWSLSISGTYNETKFKTDRVTLKYILNTLVSNAKKYSSENDKEPEFILNQKGSLLLLELRDYGIGIPADQIEVMGKPQAKVNANQEVSGMGYYLAKELTERLGHRISITSRGKEGTSVFIEFSTI